MSLNFPVQMIKDTPDGGERNLQVTFPALNDVFSAPTLYTVTGTFDYNQTSQFFECPSCAYFDNNQGWFALTFNGTSWEFTYGTILGAYYDTYTSSNTDPDDPTGTYTIDSSWVTEYIGETITVAEI